MPTADDYLPCEPTERVGRRPLRLANDHAGSRISVRKYNSLTSARCGRVCALAKARG